MSARNFGLSLAILFLIVLVSPASAQAKYKFHLPKYKPVTHVYTPYFPRCPNPGGTQVAYYTEGWHWIVGDPNLKWGSDSVYHIGNGNHVQCFCPLLENHTAALNLSQGIQTNWLKVSNITPEQKNHLISQGWVLVANGADFGLASEPYLAKNSDFHCSSSTCLKKISQTSNTTIINSINITANTGKNEIKNNTGSSSAILTGDASASATIQNTGSTNTVSN